MTTHLARTPPESDAVQRVEAETRSVNRWLVGAVAVLAAAVIALAILLIVDSGSGDDATELTAQQQALVDTADEVLAAFNAGDLELYASYFDEGSVAVLLDRGEQSGREIDAATTIGGFRGVVDQGVQNSVSDTLVLGDSILVQKGTSTIDGEPFSEWISMTRTDPQTGGIVYWTLWFD